MRRERGVRPGTGRVVNDFDVVVVGSGINSLVCGAMLTLRGRRVCILERNELIGGCIRTEALTLPGFRHDTLSTLYPLFVTAPHFSVLKDPLSAAGATFSHCDTPTAVVRPDGANVIFHKDRDRNVATLEALCVGDGAAHARAMSAVERSSPLTFGLLGGEFWSRTTLKLIAKETWSRGLDGIAGYCRDALQSCRDWVELDFGSDLARALFAPWVLHVGLGPESAMSAFMGKLVMFTLEQVGSPMVTGGSANLVSAFVRIIESRGGAVHTGCDVDRVIVTGNAARGVRLVDGREYHGGRAVVCNVTPSQLYGRLLPQDSVPPVVAQRARAFRYGRAEMQIHLALKEAPQWPEAALGSVAMLHVTTGLDGVSKAVNEAERGLLPARPTIVVAQPVAVDPSRAPSGKSILWIQLQELPSRIRGDAGATITCPPDGRWTEEVRERYADRVVGQLCQLSGNLERSIIGRRVLSPADLESLNINLVGGDPYSGSCTADQFLIWRPLPGIRNHDTPVARLYHIGASTHPGPGLGGMSGYMVANAIS